MPSCTVRGCKSRSSQTRGTGTRYFSFPKNNFCQEWIAACKRDKINLKNATICSRHFNKESYDESYFIQKKYGCPTSRKRCLKTDAIPSENLPVLYNIPAKRKNLAEDTNINEEENSSSASVSTPVSSIVSLQNLTSEPVKKDLAKDTSINEEGNSSSASVSTPGSSKSVSLGKLILVPVKNECTKGTSVKEYSSSASVSTPGSSKTVSLGKLILVPVKKDLSEDACVKGKSSSVSVSTPGSSTAALLRKLTSEPPKKNFAKYRSVKENSSSASVSTPGSLKTISLGKLISVPAKKDLTKNTSVKEYASSTSVSTPGSSKPVSLEKLVLVPIRNELPKDTSVKEYSSSASVSTPGSSKTVSLGKLILMPVKKDLSEDTCVKGNSSSVSISTPRSSTAILLGKLTSQPTKKDLSKDTYVKGNSSSVSVTTPGSSSALLLRKPTSEPTKKDLSKDTCIKGISSSTSLSTPASSTAVPLGTITSEPAKKSTNVSENYWREQAKILSEDNASLISKQTELTKEVQHLNNVLEQYFTNGQIRALKTGKRKIRWSADDICSAISLRSVSTKAYRYLRTVKNYPLPALSTLRRWVATLDLQPGILEEVLGIMTHKSIELTNLERLVVLSFDEICVSNKICLDKKYKRSVGPHDTVLTVMARSLYGQWKQIVYYNFDTTMSKDILLNIVSNLEVAKFTVVAVVSNLGQCSLRLWKEFHIGSDDNYYITHPTRDDVNIYFFVDTHHLLNLLRNHLFDNGFQQGTNTCNKSCFQKLLQLQPGAFKLTDYHLNITGTQRQNVKLAAECLSQTVAQTIKSHGQEGLMPGIDWEYSSKIIQLCNDWFDVFNITTKFDSKYHTLGIDLSKELHILDEMTTTMTNIQVGKHQRMLPFQKGILQNNKALISLFNHLKEKYDVTYLLTYKLNLKALENFFSYIRGMGDPNEDPTPMDFKHRLRWHITGKHSSSAFTEEKISDDITNENNFLNLTDTHDSLTSVCLNKF